MTGARQRLVCAVVLAWFACLPQAFASEPSADRSEVVVVLASGGAPDDRGAVVRRVHAELEAAGFVVVRVPLPSEAESLEAWSATQFREHDPLAVALLPPAGEGVAAQWWQRDAKHSIAHRSVRPGKGAADPVEVVAVRISELAFAALELQRPGDPTPGPIPPTPVAPAMPPLPFWRVAVGFGPLWSPGGLRFMFQPRVSGALAFGVARRFGIAADASATVVRARVEVDDTRHKVGIALVRAHAVWWIRPGRRVSPSLALGGGVAVGWTGPAPKRQTVVGLLSAGPGLSVALSPRVSLALGVRASVAMPRLEVASGNRRLATAGWPFLDGWVGVEIRG